MADENGFLNWVLDTVHKDALLICPDYGTHRLKDRVMFLRRRWEKEYPDAPKL